MIFVCAMFPVNVIMIYLTKAQLELFGSMRDDG